MRGTSRGSAVGSMAFLALILVLVGVNGCYTYCTGGDKVVILEDTEVKPGKDSSRYLVFTDDGVYENTDSWLRGKFDSSDFHGEIKKMKGKKVKIYYYGWRVPFLSMYPNLYKIEKVGS